jgi:hypothetical protein
MKRTRMTVILAVVIAIFSVTAVFAQEDGLKFSMSRDFGYGGGKDIQGLFSMKVTGPESLVHVDFYIDDSVIFEDTESPYKVQFNTDNYPLGEHALYAIGYTSDNRELKTIIIHVNFVTAEDGWKAVGKIIVPLLAVVFGAILVAALIPVITGKRTVAKALGEPRVYPLGGGICPKCNRPFALHFWGLNMLLNKFDRCPYCGKWSMVRPISMDKLRAAEQAELILGKGQEQIVGETDDEKLKKELDDSKYQNT